jgi:hypothetical protein
MSIDTTTNTVHENVHKFINLLDNKNKLKQEENKRGICQPYEVFDATRNINNNTNERRIIFNRICHETEDNKTFIFTNEYLLETCNQLKNDLVLIFQNILNTSYDNYTKSFIDTILLKLYENQSYESLQNRVKTMIANYTIVDKKYEHSLGYYCSENEINNISDIIIKLHDIKHLISCINHDKEERNKQYCIQTYWNNFINIIINLPIYIFPVDGLLYKYLNKDYNLCDINENDKNNIQDNLNMLLILLKFKNNMCNNLVILKDNLRLEKNTIEPCEYNLKIAETALKDAEQKLKSIKNKINNIGLLITNNKTNNNRAFTLDFLINSTKKLENDLNRSQNFLNNILLCANKYDDWVLHNMKEYMETYKNIQKRHEHLYLQEYKEREQLYLHEYKDQEYIPNKKLLRKQLLDLRIKLVYTEREQINSYDTELKITNQIMNIKNRIILKENTLCELASVNNNNDSLANIELELGVINHKIKEKITFTNMPPRYSKVEVQESYESVDNYKANLVYINSLIRWINKDRQNEWYTLVSGSVSLCAVLSSIVFSYIIVSVIL